MTLTALNYYRSQNELLLKSREMLYRLKAQMEPGSPNLDGMPHAFGTSDNVGSLAIEIAELEAKIKCLEERYLDGTEEARDYINGIQDAQTRLIFRLRFIRCFSWQEIAAVMGQGYSDEAVKKCCYRYISPEESDC